MEYTERDLEEVNALRILDPDSMADALDPSWRDSEPVQLVEPMEMPAEFVRSEREEIEQLLRLTRDGQSVASESK
jgi:hypothetical protein